MKEPNALQAQLTAKVQDLAEAARNNGGEVPPESLANLQRLAQLVQLQNELKPRAPSSRWTAAALLAATVGLASVLLLVHVRESEIELDLMVSELRFTVDSNQQLTDTLQLASLGASGLSRIGLPGNDMDGVAAPGVRLTAADARAASAGGGPAASTTGTTTGSISLQPIIASAHSEMTLSIGDVPGELRLSMSRLSEPVRADVSGTIRAAAPHLAQTTFEAATPQPVVLTPGSGEVGLDFAPLSMRDALFAPGLTITDMTLMRIDEVSEDDKTAVRAVSTVQSGILYWEELGGRELKLRAHEGLRFTHARGEIRSIGLKDGSLALNFHGRVRGMATGSLEHPRTLMPRWLDWLRENQPLSLLWGSAIYLFGLSTAVRQWWKKND